MKLLIHCHLAPVLEASFTKMGFDALNSSITAGSRRLLTAQSSYTTQTWSLVHKDDSGKKGDFRKTIANNLQNNRFFFLSTVLN